MRANANAKTQAGPRLAFEIMSEFYASSSLALTMKASIADLALFEAGRRQPLRRPNRLMIPFDLPHPREVQPPKPIFGRMSYGAGLIQTTVIQSRANRQTISVGT